MNPPIKSAIESAIFDLLGATFTAVLDRLYMSRVLRCSRCYWNSHLTNTLKWKIPQKNRKTSNISRTFVDTAPNIFSFSTWHLASMVGHRQLQDEVGNIQVWGFGAPYILTVICDVLFEVHFKNDSRAYKPNLVCGFAKWIGQSRLQYLVCVDSKGIVICVNFDPIAP